MKPFVRGSVLTLGVILIGAAVGPQPGLAQGKAMPVGSEALPIGSKAPMEDVKMMNIDGKELSIADARGEKGTLVMFSCNACPWVKAWEDRIAELGNDFRKQGIGVIVINANDPERNSEDGFDVMKSRAMEKGFHFPYVVDETSDVARAFGASRTPEAFLFDAGGELVYHGTIDDNAHEPAKVEKQYLKEALEAVVNGGAVPVAETKALGCGIKFRGEAS